MKKCMSALYLRKMKLLGLGGEGGGNDAISSPGGMLPYLIKKIKLF